MSLSDEEFWFSIVNWMNICSSLLRLTARVSWTCGSLTWPPASTTTSSWSRTCVVSWVSATRMTWELLLETGRVTSVWISCPEHQSTWPDLRPLMLELLTSRASVSVVSLDTLMTARTSSLLCYPWPCLSWPELSMTRPLNSARRWLESVKLILNLSRYMRTIENVNCVILNRFSKISFLLFYFWKSFLSFVVSWWYFECNELILIDCWTIDSDNAGVRPVHCWNLSQWCSDNI